MKELLKIFDLEMKIILNDQGELFSWKLCRSGDYTAMYDPIIYGYLFNVEGKICWKYC